MGAVLFCSKFYILTNYLQLAFILKQDSFETTQKFNKIIAKVFTAGTVLSSAPCIAIARRENPDQLPFQLTIL